MNEHHSILDSLDNKPAKPTYNFNLTDEQKQRNDVRNQRIVARLREGNASHAAIGREFGVSTNTVFKINRLFVRKLAFPKYEKLRARADKKSTPMINITAAEQKLRQAKTNVMLAEAELLEAKAQLLRQNARKA